MTVHHIVESTPASAEVVGGFSTENFDDNVNELRNNIARLEQNGEAFMRLVSLREQGSLELQVSH